MLRLSRLNSPVDDDPHRATGDASPVSAARAGRPQSSKRVRNAFRRNKAIPHASRNDAHAAKNTAA